jgi:hypothetical protein
MMVTFFLLLLLTVVLVALVVSLHFAKQIVKPKEYSPPNNTAEGPKKHFRTSSIAVMWHELGCPNTLGIQVPVEMQSGKIAIYELCNIERAWNVDWSWYDFEFVRYVDSNVDSKEEKDRPIIKGGV